MQKQTEQKQAPQEPARKRIEIKNPESYKNFEDLWVEVRLASGKSRSQIAELLRPAMHKKTPYRNGMGGAGTAARRWEIEPSRNAATPLDAAIKYLDKVFDIDQKVIERLLELAEERREKIKSAKEATGKGNIPLSGKNMKSEILANGYFSEEKTKKASLTRKNSTFVKFVKPTALGDSGRGV